MAARLVVDRIWWRSVQLGEFFNIERFPRIKGGGGSLYIEIPSLIVPETLDFLGVPGLGEATGRPAITIEAAVAGQPSVSGPIEFRPKTGGRLRIARQNRQQPNSQRHPAWTAARGFPAAPDNVQTKEEARPYFPAGGLRIYIAKTADGRHFAGFTKGVRPANMRPHDPAWDLYPSGKVVGGVIDACRENRD